MDFSACKWLTNFVLSHTILAFTVKVKVEASGKVEWWNWLIPDQVTSSPHYLRKYSFKQRLVALLLFQFSSSTINYFNQVQVEEPFKNHPILLLTTSLWEIYTICKYLIMWLFLRLVFPRRVRGLWWRLKLNQSIYSWFREKNMQNVG